MSRSLIRRMGLVAWMTLPAAGVPAHLGAQEVSSDEGYIDAGQGVRLHYQTLGTGPDTIVVIHGGPGLDAYLTPDLQPLARHHVLLSYDRRGEGRSTLVSDSARVTVDAHASDIEAVRRHFGIERVSLLAHSFGGLIAARYTHEHPDRVARLALVSPAPLREQPYTAQLQQRILGWMDSTTLAEFRRLDAARQDTTKDARATCRAFFMLLFRGYIADPNDTTALHGMRGDFCSGPPASIRNRRVTGGYTMASIRDWDWREDFHDIRSPVLVIAGAQSVVDAAALREWQAAFPAARLVLLEGSGHFPYLEQPEPFFRVVEEFFR